MNHREWGKLLNISRKQFFDLLKNTNFFKYSCMPTISQKNEKIRYLKGKPKLSDVKNFASIGLLFYEDEKYEYPQLLFCEKRIKKDSDSNNSYFSNYSFIGGFNEKLEDPLQSLVREINEEIYIDNIDRDFQNLIHYQIFNRIPSIQMNSSNIEVLPFIGTIQCKNNEEYRNISKSLKVLDEDELEAIHGIEVDRLINNYYENGLIKTKNVIEIGPTFKFNRATDYEFVIWGITARILAFVFDCVSKQI